MRSSVIIPNYNYGRFIANAIDSVLSQSVNYDEIIVVDDGSTDNSRDVIASYGDRIIPIFQQNAGQASAISAGFSVASGDIIALLDSDDVFAPTKNEIMLKLYQQHPQIGWCFHDIEEMSAEAIRDYMTHPRYLEDAGLEFVDERQRMRQQGKSIYQSPATSGLTFRRELVKPIFPLPKAESIYISDHYIKFFCLAKAEGIHAVSPLAGQAVHGNNLYTGQKAHKTRARIFINTAVELMKVAPEMKKFSHNIFISGYAGAKKYGLMEEMQGRIREYQPYIGLHERPLMTLKLMNQLWRKL